MSIHAPAQHKASTWGLCVCDDHSARCSLSQRGSDHCQRHRRGGGGNGLVVSKAQLLLCVVAAVVVVRTHPRVVLLVALGAKESRAERERRRRRKHTQQGFRWQFISIISCPLLLLRHTQQHHSLACQQQWNGEGGEREGDGGSYFHSLSFRIHTHTLEEEAGERDLLCLFKSPPPPCFHAMGCWILRVVVYRWRRREGVIFIPVAACMRIWVAFCIHRSMLSMEEEGSICIIRQVNVYPAIRTAEHTYYTYETVAWLHPLNGC